MEELLKSRQFWIWTFGILAVISVVQMLYDFNKFILFVTLLIAGVMTILYLQPPWLMEAWGSFNTP